MPRRRVSLLIVGVVGLLAAGIWASFKRDYVVPAPGLLDVTTRGTAQEVVVSGVLLSSTAHVTRTSTGPYKEGVIVRVHVDLIRPNDDLDRLTRTFSATVPRSSRTRVIYLGDGQEWETVGRLFGMPLRVPRRKDWAAKIVWRDAAS